MINITKLLSAPTGAREPFELDLHESQFPELKLKGNVRSQGELLRLEEGILLMLQKLEATEGAACVRCGKPMDISIELKQPSEWLFYEQKPLSYDDENEHLMIELERLQIDPLEPIRQELILNSPSNPHCKKTCVNFEEPGKGVQALKGLKDLYK